MHAGQELLHVIPDWCKIHRKSFRNRKRIENNCHTIMVYFLCSEYQRLCGMIVGMMDGFSTIILS